MAPDPSTAAPVVLLIDNDEGMGVLLRQQLPMYRIDTAQTLEQGLSRLNVTQPAAVILDMLVLAPGNDWAALVNRVSRASEAPVIVHTGLDVAADQPLRGMLLREGAEAVVLKGDTNSLRAAIEDGCGRRVRDHRAIPHRLHRLEQANEVTIDRLAGVEASVTTLSDQISEHDQNEKETWETLQTALKAQTDSLTAQTNTLREQTRALQRPRGLVRLALHLREAYEALSERGQKTVKALVTAAVTAAVSAAASAPWWGRAVAEALLKVFNGTG